MSKRPSLLFLDAAPRREIPAAVITDLNIDRLLCEESCTVLRRLCTPEEIMARQAIFRRLEDDWFASALSELSDALSALSQAQKAFDTAKSELEELFVFQNRCKAFVRACAAMDALVSPEESSALLRRLAAYSHELAPICALAMEKLHEVEPAMRELSRARARCDSPGSVRLRGASERSITAALEDFIRGAGCSPRPPKRPGTRIETDLSEALSRLYPDSFHALRRMRDEMRPVMTTELPALRGDIDFYLSVAALQRRGKAAGFSCCYPAVCEDKRYRASSAFDFTLLVKECAVVPNDIDFDSESAVCFLTGANGGGKTTYLRCAASNALLALCGCPAFAESLSIYPFTLLCTHFPADESFTGSGRLVEEAARVDSMLAQCTSDSFIFLNETYSGTDDVRGAQLTMDTAHRIQAIGAFALHVTHFHEIASAGFTMLTTVIDEADSSRRTFRIVKQRGAGSSFAHDILKKYKLDAVSLAERSAVT